MEHDEGKEDSFEEINTENREDDSEVTEISKKRKQYTNEFKREAVLFSIKYNVSRAASQFRVSRKCIQRWAKNYNLIEEDIEKNGSKRMRLEGGGRHLQDESFDRKLSDWIRGQRANKMRVSRRVIKLKALQFSTSDGNFSASNGWLEAFMQRHNLVSRRPTTVCQKPPAEYREKLIEFLLFVEKSRLENSYTHIYAADETAVYIDFSRTNTVETRGARQVSVKSTGHDKVHITVMLCARADGMKCRPYVLLPNKRPIPEIVKQFGKRLELCWCGKTFFNDGITTDFLKKILGNSLFGARLLVWDSFRCHISDSTKKTLKALRIHTATVPGGTTKFIQAPDVFWNSPFKAKISQAYEDWMLHGEKTMTPQGNMRAPPMKVYLQWIIDAWESLPGDLIRKSFKGCGVNNTFDGSEDYLIHCFKKDGEISDGVEMLQKARKGTKNDVIKLIEEISLSECHNQDDYDSDLALDFD